MSKQLFAERDGWRYRASFWRSVVMMSILRNASEGFEVGPPQDTLSILIRSCIFTGLENGKFVDNTQQPDPDELDDLFEEENDQMPWSAVVEIAAEAEVDATEVLRDYIDNTQDGLQRALGLAGFKMEGMEPTFAGVPVTPDMFHEIAQGKFGPQFEKHFADKYILHVMHGPNPCQHPYDSLDMAIEGAAIDLQRGIITEISHITHNGILVLDKDDLSRRVAEIGNAGLN